MSSSQKKKKQVKVVPQQQKKKFVPVPAAPKPLEPLRYSLIVTGAFFIVALLGMFHHEMWRDEHQAWLVARDANSYADVFRNMKYEGNPALWHSLLFIITRFTHNPVFMQALHLAIATGSIFIINRYAPIGRLYKILFSFGYFPLFEYTMISRSYGLGMLLLFVVCVLYKNRASHYVLIGVLLALLANVAIFDVVIALGIAGVLFLDHFFVQKRNSKLTLQLFAGLSIAVVGIIFSLYQIWPTKDNSFPAAYPTTLFDYPRIGAILSRLFSTYFYIPSFNGIHFWNTNIYTSDYFTIDQSGFGAFLNDNPAYMWAWFILPLLCLAIGIISFLRKPMILLLYVGLTLGLFSVMYYTFLIHYRYCGHLLIVLVICFWLSEYYAEKYYRNFLLRGLSGLGKKISWGFLGVALSINVIGGISAYATDWKEKFSTSKDAANYIKENKLDSLQIVGGTDFVISPLATFLDRKIYYSQMRAFGSFTVWNKQRIDQPEYSNMLESIKEMMKDRTRLLLVKDFPPRITTDGKNYTDMEHTMIAKDLQLDLLQKFPGGIVEDEKYYIYLVQRVDSAKVDYSKYMRVY